MANVAFPASTSERCIMTLGVTSTGYANVGFTATAGRIFFYTGGSDGTLAVTGITNLNTSRVAIDVSRVQNVGRTLTVEVDGETYTNSDSAAATTASASAVFVLGNGATGTVKYGYIGKIYSASYYADGVRKCNLVPCYRKSDGVIGMYDKVAGKFYTNSGTGTLVKGADVA